MTAGYEFTPLLTAVAEFLDRSDRLLVAPDQASELAERACSLIRKIESADDRIVIGLVGGTGVGKSTLINALAGQEISVSTDLRPTTSHLVVYRHRDNAFSLAGDEQAHLHESPLLRRVTLADFPDFDSIEPAHRLALSRHFPKLDLLLWVADPVKYADLVFFEWLSLAPQARVNSLFILNKVDEFQERYGAEAGAVVDEVMADFKSKLFEYAHIADPEIMPLSALKKEDDIGSNGFQALTNRIEALSEKKRRLSIKNLNLAAMADGLLADFREALALGPVRDALSRMEKGLNQGRADLESLVQTETRRLSTILRKPWREGLAAAAREHAPWPLGFFLFIWDSLKGLIGRGPKDRLDVAQLPPPDLSALEARLRAMLDEIAFLMSSKGIRAGAAWRKRLDDLPAPEKFSRSGAGLLSQAAIENANQLTRRFKWRVKHHLLPLLVLVYPYLPMIIAGISGFISDGTNAAPSVHISFGIKDLLPLFEVILGLYLVETIYFAYRLDRAAGRAIDDLSRLWGEKLLDGLNTDLLSPLEAICRDVREEADLAEKIGPPDRS